MFMILGKVILLCYLTTIRQLILSVIPEFCGIQIKIEELTETKEFLENLPQNASYSQQIY
jgi:hypothetical protein